MCRYFCCRKKKNIQKNIYIIWFTDKKICNLFIIKNLKKHMIILPRHILEPISMLFSFFKFKDKFNYYYIEKRNHRILDLIKRKKPLRMFGKKEDEYDVLIKTNSIISFSPNEKYIAEEISKKIGLLSDDKFICFASRSKDYKNETVEINRNSNIDNQIEAINYLISNNYKAVRLGKNNFTKLKWSNDKIIDLSFSEFKSDFFDLYLMSKCKFFLTSAGGINYMASFMRKKVLLVDFYAFDHLQDHSMAFTPILLPKKIYSKKENRFLSYGEIFERDILKMHNKSLLENLGYDLRGNSQKEVGDAVKAMHLYMENKIDLKPHRIIQQKFWDIFNKHYDFDTKELVICPSFYNNNSSLFN